MKAVEVLRDAIIGEENSNVGSLDSNQEELTIVVVDENEIEGQEYLYGWFEYTVSKKYEKVEKVESVKKEEDDRFFTPDGDDSGDDTWGLKAERERVRESYDEVGWEYGNEETDTCGIGIELSEISGVENGVRMKLSTKVEGYNWGIWCSEEAKKVSQIPAFGNVVITAIGEISISYDMVLGKVEDFETDGVKIYNTLMEYMVSMFFEAQRVVENYVEPDRSGEEELEELEP